MVSLQHVEEQLKRIGCNFKLWGRAEIRELGNILMPDEEIAQAVNGTYEGGFAMLVTTNYRVLMVDRKPMLLTIEDIRYDMIAEVDYHNRVLMSGIRVFTPMRNLVFNSWSHHRLRKSINYIQQKVMETRQQGMMGQQFSAPQQSAQPGYAMQPQSAQASASASPMLSTKMSHPVNPYTKTPMLSRRRRFPSFY